MVWQQDLDPKPAANRDRVLAYSNGACCRGWVWFGLVEEISVPNVYQRRNTRTSGIKALDLAGPIIIGNAHPKARFGAEQADRGSQ